MQSAAAGFRASAFTPTRAALKSRCVCVGLSLARARVAARRKTARRAARRGFRDEKDARAALIQTNKHPANGPTACG